MHFIKGTSGTLGFNVGQHFCEKNAIKKREKYLDHTSISFIEN